MRKKIRRTASSAEARTFTVKNLKTANKYVSGAREFADGILLTGSNAWGAHYAVNKNSDIDLLIAAETIEDLRHIIKSYVANGLLPPREQKRFAVYLRLYKENKARQFSVIGNHHDAAVSIDFLLTDTVREIATLKPMGDKIIKDNMGAVITRTINEFRSNPPRATGYSLDDIGSLRKLTYHPKFKEIKEGRGSLMGYLSETLVDGRGGTAKSTTYFLGVMSFFLAIHPIILLDKHKKLADAVKTIQSNIDDIIKHKRPVYITRQERMPRHSLALILKSLAKRRI